MKKLIHKIIARLIEWSAFPQPEPVVSVTWSIPETNPKVPHWTDPHTESLRASGQHQGDCKGPAKEIYIDLSQWGNRDLSDLPVHVNGMSDMEATTDHFDEIAEAGRLEREGNAYGDDLFLNLWDYLLEIELSNKR